MATLDEVYRKFGEVAEAAQILETALGNLLMMHKCIDADLNNRPNPNLATEFYEQINQETLSRLMKSLRQSGYFNENLDQLLRDALVTRNRLTHSFYEQHNFRRFSNDGREIMLRDLEAIHEVLLEANNAVIHINEGKLKTLGTEIGEIPIPPGHVPL